MRFPVNKPYAITQKFSPQHPGIDIAPRPVNVKRRKAYAPEKGRVVRSGYLPALEGNYVIMRGKTKYYYFGHFAKRFVLMDDLVKQGQPLGEIGRTGAATGIHTHHEVRKTLIGGQIDPTKYYKENQMYKGRSAKEWYSQAKTWKFKAKSRAKIIAKLKDMLNKFKLGGK